MSSATITINDLTAILQEIGLPLTPLDYYPIGSYYETSDTSFNPNTAWGGTWVLETEGQVHVSAGSNYTVSGAATNTSDGGEINHVLTPSETATKNHSHTINHNHDFTNPTVNSHSHAASSDSTLNFVRTKTSGGLTLTGQRAYTNASSSGTYYAVTSSSGTIGSMHDTASSSPGTSGGSVTQHTGSSGGQTEVNGSAHNNMPPYIIVNRWHRTA